MATTERQPPTESTPGGVTDEDLLHSSQSAHFHCRSQAVRFPGDLDDEQRAEIQQQFDGGDVEPVPVQVTARNRQGEAIKVRSEWDGVQLHLDVCPTAAPMLALRPALAAMARYYREHRRQAFSLLAAVLVVVGALTLGVMGVL